MVDPAALHAEQRARVLIDAQLAAAGWSVQDREGLNLFAAEGVAAREVAMAPGHCRVDYMLFGGRKPVGVIEAKPEGTTDLATMAGAWSVRSAAKLLANAGMQGRGSGVEAIQGGEDPVEQTLEVASETTCATSVRSYRKSSGRSCASPLPPRTALGAASRSSASYTGRWHRWGRRDLSP